MELSKLHSRKKLAKQVCASVLHSFGDRLINTYGPMAPDRICIFYEKCWPKLTG